MIPILTFMSSTHNLTPGTATFTAHVTAYNGDELHTGPLTVEGLTLDLCVTRDVVAGVCGPFISPDETFASLAELDAFLVRYELHRVAEFGPTCANGFASAALELRPR